MWEVFAVFLRKVWSFGLRREAFRAQTDTGSRR